ncbi:hypothetical protein NL298_27695, partial [Klebsiella pneumoniae]|nr:hypothetical protein [Klebsiella pneumoniae]
SPELHCPGFESLTGERGGGFAVNGVMVAVTQQNKVLHVGFAAVFPRHDVMHLTHRRWPVTARELAAPVAGDHGETL